MSAQDPRKGGSLINRRYVKGSLRVSSTTIHSPSNKKRGGKRGGNAREGKGRKEKATAVLAGEQHSPSIRLKRRITEQKGGRKGNNNHVLSFTMEKKRTPHVRDQRKTVLPKGERKETGATPENKKKKRGQSS